MFGGLSQLVALCCGTCDCVRSEHVPGMLNGVVDCLSHGSACVMCPGHYSLPLSHVFDVIIRGSHTHSHTRLKRSTVARRRQIGT